jgi:hypothetical protein
MYLSFGCEQALAEERPGEDREACGLYVGVRLLDEYLVGGGGRVHQEHREETLSQLGHLTEVASDAKLEADGIATKLEEVPEEEGPRNA